MATKYLMQARDGLSGLLVTWRSALPDWTGVDYPGLGEPLEVVNAGGGLDTGTTIPDKAITLGDGSYVTLSDGSYATTT